MGIKLFQSRVKREGFEQIIGLINLFGQRLERGKILALLEFLAHVSPAWSVLAGLNRSNEIARGKPELG